MTECKKRETKTCVSHDPKIPDPHVILLEINVYIYLEILLKNEKKIYFKIYLVGITLTINMIANMYKKNLCLALPVLPHVMFREKINGNWENSTILITCTLLT